MYLAATSESAPTSSCVKSSQRGVEMNSLYREIPRGLKKLLRPYLKELTKPQRVHFTTFITGLITNENKTIQEVNDALSARHQSSLNRFLNNHDLAALNEVRLACVQRALPTSDDGLIIIDDTLAHKTGKQMEAAGFHRSGITKQKEWGHNIVNSYYAHPERALGYPITAEIFTNKNNTQYPYCPIKRMGLDQVHYARAHGVRGVVCMDSLYYADYVVHELDDDKERYLVGAPSTLKISIERQPRIGLADYAKRISYTRLWHKNQWYHVHDVQASIRGVGIRRIVISYREADPDNKKGYVTNLTCSQAELLRLLVCRWSIECWHRDAKQHLGLEDYQVRKDRAVRNVVLAVLIAYTVLVLSMLHSTLRRMAERLQRPLRTIGELCRFMRLAARKGWRWVTRMMRERLALFKGVLNREVFIKNAKA